MTQSKTQGQIAKESLSAFVSNPSLVDWTQFTSDLMFDCPNGSFSYKNATQGALSSWSRAFSDTELRIHEVRTFTNLVVIEAHISGSQVDAFFGIPATHKMIAFPLEAVFMFNQEGKVFRIKALFDLATFIRQLGHFPSLPDKPNTDPLLTELRGLLPQHFTSREIECFALYLHNFSYKQIGETYSISPRTVETHIQNGLAKLECSSHSQAVDYMRTNNLIPTWKNLCKQLLRI